MSSAITSLRAVLTIAVLLMAVIVAWKVSTPVAGLVDTYRIHLTLMTPSNGLHPSPRPKVVTRYVVINPRVCH